LQAPSVQICPCAHFVPPVHVLPDAPQ
jgi:hypothetical protein